MSTTKEPRPAQRPGEAESPPHGEKDPTVERAIKHSDKTEHTQAGTKPPPKAG